MPYLPTNTGPMPSLMEMVYDISNKQLERKRLLKEKTMGRMKEYLIAMEEEEDTLRSAKEIMNADPTEEDMKPDPVNSPSHYKLNHKGIECIVAMEAMLTPEEFRGYLRGNSFKYRWRYRYKNRPVEDLEKAQWYENKLLEFERDCEENDF